MTQRFFHLFLMYGITALSIGIAGTALWRPVWRRSSLIWWTAALLGLVFIGRTFYFFQTWESKYWCYDFALLWYSGAHALQGEEPYALQKLDPDTWDRKPVNDEDAEGLCQLVYPPFALPFFKLFALVPLATAKMIWTTMNVLICLSLGLLARGALLAQDGDQPMLPPSMAALLTAPVILSLSTHSCLQHGQLAFLVTMALLGALTVQTWQPPRPALTAACLGLASIKPHTMVPFLILFLRSRDIRTWLFLSLIGAALLLAAGDLAELTRRFSAFREAVSSNRGPGRLDDFSLLNEHSYTMMGLEHVFYRIGMVNRPAVTALAFFCTLGIGAWLAYVINRKQPFPRGASCSLVSLYSMLFIYHRLYDLSILILPLLYSASRVNSISRQARWCHAWVIVAILVVLNAPYGELNRFQTLYSSSAIVRIFILPSVTYLIISAVAALYAATSLELRCCLADQPIAEAPGTPLRL
jgi:hypothetical protein